MSEKEASKGDGPKKNSGDGKAPLKTLEKLIAFNAGYRNQWRTYFQSLDEDGMRTAYDRLTAGLDEESKLLCEAQVRLAPHCFPDPILSHVYADRDLLRKLLPRPTRRGLEKAGFFGGEAARLESIQKDLRLPIPPLEELLVNSGLSFVPNAADDYIRDRHVIDGGAFIGDTAHLFIKKYGAKTVHAFEPSGETIATMTELVSKWGLEGRIRPQQAALSDRPSTLDLWGVGVGASSIRKVGFGEDVRESVRATSIDAYVAESNIPSIGFIKLDVEGAELDAIRGATSTLVRDRPLLIISIYHTARDFFEVKPYIENLDLGYRFMVRKLTPDIFKELVLICVPDRARNDANS